MDRLVLGEGDELVSLVGRSSGVRSKTSRAGGEIET